MRVVAIVQARMGSRRCPGKVLAQINGRPLIEILFKRLARASSIDRIVLATSLKQENQPLISVAKRRGVSCFEGDEEDVLGRYQSAANLYDADAIVRITGDCPLTDPAMVDHAVNEFQKNKVDYLSNSKPPTYPDGLDIEVFSAGVLKYASQYAVTKFDREHVTPYIKRADRFSSINLEHDVDLSSLRWTVDEHVDLAVMENVFRHFDPDIFFLWQDVLALQQSAPELFQENAEIERNQGMSMSSGQKLWGRAKRVIPGGNMLLSKRPEMFLPDVWPSYFSRAKGCSIWDLDGNEYLDMSLMGVGTNVLGYGHPEVDDAVRDTISRGNLSTLNCPEEVLLAEKLVSLHPWADMARFARSGGEANAIAVRIARAATGKDKIAFCGYHGWHDWYLSSNLTTTDSLAGHLLPGLEPKGVPSDLQGTALPFTYNNFQELERLVAENNIGAIKMEVVRNIQPEDGFLENVRTLAKEKGIVLIFDECTSGFREAMGGIHKKYRVDPDVAVFGKTLGNGYAITAVLGRREVMEAAQETFVSSTFWTERIGPSAALKTLEVMERTRSWEVIENIGVAIKKRWQELSYAYGLPLATWGLPSLPGFTISGENTQEYKTLVTQELLAHGILASNSVYCSIEHSPELVDRYFDSLEPVFSKIKQCEDSGDIGSMLNSPVCHSGFKRLN